MPEWTLYLAHDKYTQLNGVFIQLTHDHASEDKILSGKKKYFLFEAELFQLT